VSKTWVVESLANVLAGREDDSPFLPRDGCETVIDRLALLLAHAAAQDHNVINARRQLVLEAVEVLIPFRQDQRRTPIANGFENVLANSPSTRLVVDQLLVEGLKFHTLVRIRVPRRLEGCRLNQHEVLEGTRRGLCASVYLMPNWTALHEDDRMVAVLACDCCRQSNDESGLGLAYHLLETMRRQVMALVDNHMAILRNAVIDDAFSDQTLNDADVNLSSRSVSSSADSSDRFGGYIEERG
jgi:septum formation topological specificity factor MinE